VIRSSGILLSTLLSGTSLDVSDTVGAGRRDGGTKAGRFAALNRFEDPRSAANGFGSWFPLDIAFAGDGVLAWAIAAGT
jgi:hypothetical protein